MKKPMVFEGIVAMLLILLVFAMYIMVSGGARENGWDVDAGQQVWDVYPGGDGTLYAFLGPTGNTILALDDDGHIKWKFQVPEQWRVLNAYNRISPAEDGGFGSYIIVKPEFAADNGTLYVYLRENRTTAFNHYPWEEGYPNQQDDNDSTIEERLVAISQDGRQLWSVRLGDYYIPASDVSVYVVDGKAYAFYSYNVTAFDREGSPLFGLRDVSAPPAVDEEGRMYAMACEPTSSWPWMGYRSPVGLIKAFYENGSLYWVNFTGKALSTSQVAECIRYQYGRLPIYQNNTLYIPLYDGVMAMNIDGSIRWSAEFDNGCYRLFPYLPVDVNGNVYLYYAIPGRHDRFLCIIDKNGCSISTNQKVTWSIGHTWGDPYAGYIYSIEKAIVTGGNDNWENLTLENLTTYEIAAHDLINGTLAWRYTIPVDRKGSFIINNQTIATFDQYAYVSESPIGFVINTGGDAEGRPTIYPYYPLKISATKDAVYLSFFTANYESPVILGKSNCTYSGGIYALSKNGSLLWYKPIGAFASSLAVNNATVYYGTRNGQIGAGQNDMLAGGLTLIALAYTFIRFFMVGAVSRARDRLGKNENRSSVLKFIAENPGMTMHDISRGIHMNIGTVRYHVFILKLNHRVISYMADDKHVRYFINSNSYSVEERFIISLMRRDGIRRILKLLADKPGLTNAEISCELKLPESAVSRYMKELSEKGVVAREGECGLAYTIKSEYREAILQARGL
ncbi:winged helix-turn-helix transcriptional regulator [Methanocella conradii]|uniref:winged helix-turn-helix transcriptional regulator n=1 Tax=Methanocella conradii TaxID=1175444 RepID=UPI00157DA4C8|nr:winged helix-turn-helix transcriptional regulator [Methanocella conradii]